MSFRDDRDALRERVEQLEQALSRTEAERDEARAALAEDDSARRARMLASTRFPAGTPVLVEWQGRWWNATVVRVETPGAWHVHYDGWSRSWDETVGPGRIVARTATPPGPLASDRRGGVIALVVLAALVAAGIVVAWASARP